MTNTFSLILIIAVGIGLFFLALKAFGSVLKAAIALGVALLVAFICFSYIPGKVKPIMDGEQTTAEVWDGVKQDVKNLPTHIKEQAGNIGPKIEEFFKNTNEKIKESTEQARSGETTDSTPEEVEINGDQQILPATK